MRTYVPKGGFMMTKQRKKVYRVHIQSKIRFYLFLTTLIILLTFIISPLLYKGLAMNPPSLKSVYVEKGDTLWGIAKKTLPKRVDIRDYIQEIKKVNYLKSANIKVGQELIVPIYDYK